RRFVAVPKQVSVIAQSGSCRAQQIFGQNHSRPRTGTKGAVTALPNAIKPVAGSNDPDIRSRPLQVFAKVLKYRGRFRRKRGKVIYGLVHTRCQACGGDVVAEDSPRSEEHTSELQSRGHLVCRLLLEKKKDKKQREHQTRK